MSEFSTSDKPVKSGLVQSFGLFTLVMIVLSSMIGSGVFKKIAPMSANMQHPWLVMLAWVLAGLVSLFGALGNAEVGSMITEPGGQYAYFKQMYGRFVAYMYGWTMFSVVQTATAAAVAMVFAQATSVIFHEFGYEWSELTVKLLAVGAIALFTFVNYKGAAFGGSLNSIFMGTIVTALVLVIILNLTMAGGSLANLNHAANADGISALLRNIYAEAGVTPIGTTFMELKAQLNTAFEASAKGGGGLTADVLTKINFANIKDIAAGSEAVTASWGSILSALFATMLGAFWAYEGWNNVGYLGAEVKNPSRNIPLGLTIGVLVVMAIYTLINFSYLYALPVEQLVNVHLHKNQIGAVEVLKSYMGSGGILLVSALIALANFNTTNNSILTAPRVTYAMAADGLFFKQIAAIHPINKTPGLAIIIMGLWAIMFVWSGQFDALTDMLVFASFIFYFMAAIGVFILRSKMPDAPRSYRVNLIFPAVFAIFSFFLVIFTIYNDPMNAAKGLGLMALGLPLYFYFERDKG